MTTALQTYWVKIRQDPNLPPSFRCPLGIGVTAYDEGDAIGLIKTKLFYPKTMPNVLSIETNLDMSKLDPKHILPNMRLPTERGIWFPMI